MELVRAVIKCEMNGRPIYIILYYFWGKEPTRAASVPFMNKIVAIKEWQNSLFKIHNSERAINDGQFQYYSVFAYKI